MLTINYAALAAEVEAILKPHAFAGGAYLTEVISHPGEGQQWPGNPNPSSLPGAYPAIQSGDLLASIDVRLTGPLTYSIGSFEDMNAAGFEHAVKLESTPEDRGGRAFMEMLAHDPAFHQAVLEGQ